MIWHLGKIVPDNSVAISVLDRTFEHGLGLFESLRTWNGVPVLLGRHLDRLLQSARVLGLPIDHETLPDAEAVRALVVANGIDQDARVRITLSGGLSDADSRQGRSTVWMTASALSVSQPEDRIIIEGTMMVTDDDPLARHKSLNYWRKALGYAAARADQAHDLLCVTPDGWLCESSRYNLFLVACDRLYTPCIDLPILPGVMRRVVLEQATGLGIPVEEGHLPMTLVNEATEAFLTNSVRGIVPISRLVGKELASPGAVTETLSRSVARWLAAGGDRR